MCVVSMVIGSKTVEWEQRYPQQPYVYPGYAQMPTQQEIDEFRRLLESARQYDREHNQPKCSDDEKRHRIRKLADQLGIDLDFV